MRVCGIASEYNPFHNGHKYQIEEIKESGFDAVVAVMSGNFVQRGEPAVLEKHSRAKQALLNGVDLVVELPLPYALSSAERFAMGAVSILDSLGLVDSLCFGSECGDIKILNKIASTEVDGIINNYLSDGVSYPCAFEKAIETALGSSCTSVLKGSNNLLGIEYIRAIKTLSSEIKPFTIKRKGIGHDCLEYDGKYISALNIRENIFSEKNKQFMPESSFDILQNEIDNGLAPVTVKNGERAILSRLRALEKNSLSALPDVSEGLDNSLYNAVMKSSSIEELFDNVKSKRYTMSRIKRLVLHAYLGIDSSFYDDLPPYIRVIGMNENGRQILKEAKKTASKPVYMLASDFKNADAVSKKFFCLEATSTDLYSLFMPKIMPCGKEYITNPVIILD